ncbi:MAG: PA14 domain-containing protein [Verrucomicrobia bacterium]|nr:PA14 domain-containing protein [Verrucomicrobiota bacterium]
MKTHSTFCRRTAAGFRRIGLLTLLGAAFASVGRVSALPVAGAFVEPLPGFITVDTRVDSSVGTPTAGTTYVLGRNDSSTAILRKYDASGAELLWDSGTNQVYLTGITPKAMAIGGGSTNLYIVGGGVIYRVDAKTGGLVGSTSGSYVSFQGVYFANDTVYVCGNFSSTIARSVMGRTLAARGSLTFGDTGAGSVNTANSIVVDDSGDIYVGGKLGTGTFVSDVFSSGYFAMTYKHRASGIGNLTDAQTVLDSSSYPNEAANVWANAQLATPCGIGTSYDNGDHNYIVRASGAMNVPTAGQYTFTSTTDDGAWLYIDGQNVIYDNTSHASLATSKTISLFAGLHSVDWLYWNGGGPGNGSLNWGPAGGSSACVAAADFSAHVNKGYVFKFSGDLSTFRNAHFTTATSGTGGEINELAFIQGWVYAIGSWKGSANNTAINPADPSNAGSADVDILKLDTGLQLKARATVKGAADNTGFSITADEGGNAYISGSYGPQSADFFGNGDATNHPFASLSSSKLNIFIAQLDSNFTFKWVNAPSGTPPNFSFPTLPRVRWNSVLQRVFWTGYFNSGSLLMGNPNAVQTLNGPEGFIAVLDPDGKFTERVNLTVVSDYGVSGTQVKPFGGPALNTNCVANLGNTKPVIKGAQVTVAVPGFLYRDATNDDITIATQLDATKIDTLAETRIGCTGHPVAENVPHGIASSYTFTLTKDTIVTFNWLVEHALRVKADFSATAGTDGSGTPGHIVGLTSEAAGSPVPSVQKHWIKENEPVIATIDAASDDLDYLSRGLAVRYAVTGYDAFGPANTLGAAGTTSFIPFLGSDARRQVPQFLMTGPASITYHWKLKIGVQINTTGLKSAGFPLVHVTSDPGQVVPPTQADGQGTGTFFFDENTSLQIGTIKNQNTTQLKGWFNGDGTVFASSGSLSNLTGAFDVTNSSGVQSYVSQPVVQLKRPGRVMWDYGDRIFEETVFIGNTVTFGTVDDPAVKAKLRMDLPPEHADVTESPQGSTSDDMAMWDAAGKKYYPLRPGVVMSYWYTSADPAERVIIRLTFKYPVVAHYRHIANTRPVPLDPSTNDLVTFKELKFTEATTGAAVDQNGSFSATGPGKTVLLFNETSSIGRGGKVITPRVRVVETKNWNDQLPATQNAVIGRKITSAYDTAGLGTGYLFFNKARYNTAIYSRDNLSGPIIPVNLFPTAGPDEQLVVVWYESRDTMLWPYQAVRYQPAWPTTAAEGLHRIVIASRFGNESVAADGTDQIVVPAETIGTNSYPAETQLNPARFQQVQIYNQPDRTLPGFNPNEEHALLAPSLRSAAVSPQPMAAYALRDGDLNVTAKDASYTSDHGVGGFRRQLFLRILFLSVVAGLLVAALRPEEPRRLRGVPAGRRRFLARVF